MEDRTEIVNGEKDEWGSEKGKAIAKRWVDKKDSRFKSERVDRGVGGAERGKKIDKEREAKGGRELQK